MNTVKFKHQHILAVLFIAAVFFMAIIKIEDTDTWMHLSFGKLIWSLKGLPATEPFVYTSLERPFSYSSWLFGLLYYLAYLAFNVYGVILLMALTVTTAFFILLRDSLRPYKNNAVAILVMLVMVILVRHRFVQRPDTFMMVFLSFSIFSLNAYLYDRKKYIYLLPLTHMLWANSHSSINLMFIPFGAFIAGGLAQNFLIKKGLVTDETLSYSQLKTVSAVFAASFAASLVSPYFLDQYLLGPQYMTTSWFKQEIFELMTPTWNTTKWPYLLSASVLISFALNARRFSVMHLLLVIPFMVLSFTSYRFIFLLGIISGPVLARNLSSFLASQSWDRVFYKKIVTAGVSVCIVAIAVYVVLKGTPIDSGRKSFGFGINDMYLPEDALKYMDKNRIYGRMFHPFAWGGYIVWRDFPERSVFVDPRGYISVDLLEKMALAVTQPSVMDKLVDTYGIEAILLDYPPPFTDLDADIDFVMSNQGWALVYWDDVSLLYLKRGGRYSPIIEKEEYRLIDPAKNIMSLRARLHDIQFRDNLIKELRRNVEETDCSRAYTALSFVYNESGFYEDAIRTSEKVLQRDIGNFVDAYTSLGFAHLRLGNIDESIRNYEKSLSFAENPTVLFNIGLNYLNKGDKKRALKYLKRTLEKNKNLLSAYPLIMSIYRESGQEEEVRKTSLEYERAITENEGEEHFKNGLEAYFRGNLVQAVNEFRKSVEVNPQNPVTYSNLGYVYFDSNKHESAYEYQRKALEIDPNHANAHYGLALIYQEWGDLKSAQRHWQEYLRVAPTGYYSRRAAEAIEAIKKKH